MSLGQRTRARVVCLGNSLVGDDAAGSAVYERLLRFELPGDVEVHLLGLAGLDILELMSGEDLLIVVDAVQFGTQAGTVHVRDWNDLPEAQSQAVSVHGIGLAEALQVALRLYPDRAPHRAVLVGIEGRRFDELGTGLTPAVADALDSVVEKILGFLGQGNGDCAPVPVTSLAAICGD